MSRGLKLYFAVLVPWALCAMLFPVSILFGLAAGVLPGIILFVAPFLLLCSLLWLPLRSALRVLADALSVPTSQTSHGAAIDVLAALAVVAAVIAVPKTINHWVEPKIAELRHGDKSIFGPISLPDRVSLKLPVEATEPHITCETLCQRLLYNHAVRQVFVIGPNGKAIGFMLQIGVDCPKPRVSSSSIRWKGDGNEDSVLDRVKKRIAEGECLVAFQPGAGLARFLITVYGDWDVTPEYPITWNFFAQPVKTWFVEIIAPSGETVFRSTQVEASPLMVPLLAQIGGWARERIVRNDIGLYGRDILPDVLGKDATRLPDDTSLKL